MISSILLEHGYAAVLVILVLCGLGLPIPEEITLIGAGVVVYEGRAELYSMMATTVLGILIGDSILFWLGRRFGPRLLERRLFRKLLHAERMARVQAQFDAHALKVVFFARFFAGIRGCVYFTAGTLGMKYRTFLLLDLAGALLSAPISVWLGHHFGGTIEEAGRWIRDFDRAVICIVIAIVAWTVGRALWTNRRSNVAAVVPPPAERPTERPPA